MFVHINVPANSASVTSRASRGSIASSSCGSGSSPDVPISFRRAFLAFFFKLFFFALCCVMAYYLFAVPSSAVWVPDGVYQPEYHPFTFQLGDPGPHNVLYIFPGVVYWPNSDTGKVDLCTFSKIAIRESASSSAKLDFYIDSESSPYISIDSAGQCINTNLPKQVYEYSDFVSASPGVDFFYIAPSASELFAVTFPVAADRTNTPGGGSIPDPDAPVKSNIYTSIRDLLNDTLFNGEAVAGSIEFNIATLISIICCAAIIMLPFLACWGIVRIFLWR